ncbi:MAG: phosphoglucomutase/phosphomannomutase family protein [Flavobacteriales bacterium]|nr:phosphoglucomutase/phosphomannomutase family protein [Flavobacteriales bacterium]
MITKQIKFGTDGWRAIIGREYTVENVARLSEGVAQWALKQSNESKIALGYDCRFNGSLFAETVAKVFVRHEIQVYMAPSFVSTPAVAMATRDLGCVCGVVITASHNPPSYNGYKLKGSFGGPMQENNLAEIERLVPESLDFDIDHLSLETNFCTELDIEELYLEALRKRFDINAIRNSGVKIGVDSMFGSGQNVWRNLLPEAYIMHGEVNPTFNGVSPEPVLKNLSEFCDHLKKSDQYDLGVANDGDADRIALFDGNGNYIDSHHVILLLIHYLSAYKKMKGKVVTAFSSVSKITKLCKHYSLPLDIVKIGFKHASKIMITEDVMLAGEESGGIAISDHVPERDGIWSALTILEWMVNEKKSINELINEVYAIVGVFYFNRTDLKIAQDLKEEVINKCNKDLIKSFGTYQVQNIETLDGYKYWLSEEEWVMIRPSGTEPVLRIYVEAPDKLAAAKILEATLEEIGCAEFA